MLRWLAVLLIALVPTLAQAAPGVANAIDGAAKTMEQGRPLGLSLQILLVMGVLTILPSMVLMMTSFTRIIIVLAILRQALGLQQTPPNQVLVGLALFLSLFVMRPVVDDISTHAYAPYQAGEVTLGAAVERSGDALHGFMRKQVREADVKLFLDLADMAPVATPEDLPYRILVPAFMTSELKTAFQIGFLLFLPFLIIDLVVASALMALGMMMLSPTVIAMPFKLLLFVLIDGWALTMGSLAQSFAA